MKINQNTVLQGKRVALVPYTSAHVPRYAINNLVWGGGGVMLIWELWFENRFILQSLCFPFKVPQQIPKMFRFEMHAQNHWAHRENIILMYCCLKSWVFFVWRMSGAAINHIQLTYLHIYSDSEPNMLFGMFVHLASVGNSFF